MAAEAPLFSRSDPLRLGVCASTPSVPCDSYKSLLLISNKTQAQLLALSSYRTRSLFSLLESHI